MSDDLGRAIKHLGCTRGEVISRRTGLRHNDGCIRHPYGGGQPEQITWPCSTALALAAEFAKVRADECERLRPLLDEECPHEPDEHAEGTCEVCDAAFAVDAALQGRAEKHREAT